jgi:hypothetical protein
MQNYIVLAATAFLAACGTNLSPVSMELQINDSHFTGEALVGRTFSGPTVSQRGNRGGGGTAEVDVASGALLTMTIDGTTTSLTNLGGDRYQTLDGFTKLRIATRLTGSAPTPDVLYFIAEDRPTPFLAGPRLSFFVDGNKTLSQRLPSGSVAYHGVARGANMAGQRVDGRVNLNVNFSNQSLTGTLSGVNPRNTNINYNLSGGIAANGALSAFVSGTNAPSGSLSGNIYGTGADQAAGIFTIFSQDSPMIGTFAAID